MRTCPYCGYSNYDKATECRKCQASFGRESGAAESRSFWCGPEKAQGLRGKALVLMAFGVMSKLYWGGHLPWRVIDNPTLASVRHWLEPALLVGGALLYVAGFLLRWV